MPTSERASTPHDLWPSWAAITCGPRHDSAVTPQPKEIGMDAEPIALVGIGCTLPGKVHGLDDMHTVLWEGRDCVEEIPSSRWDVDEFYDPDPLALGKTYTRHGGF